MSQTILDNYEYYNQHSEEFTTVSLGGDNCHDWASSMIAYAGGKNPGTNAWTLDPGREEVMKKPAGPMQSGLWKSELQDKVINPTNQQWLSDFEAAVHDAFEAAKQEVDSESDSDHKK